MTELFSCVVDLGLALGVRDISKLEGCWEQQVDEDWWIALNGHPQAIKCSKDIEVEPATIWVEYKGFPEIGRASCRERV